MSTTYWDRLRAGWGVVWCVAVEGIDAVWCERVPTGLTGGTLHADLVVDRSAEIGSLADRNTGLGAGLPFTMRLRDTPAVRAAIQAPSVDTVLNGTISATTGPAISVESTTGFAASGTIWIGTEAITYTGTTATQFTGCTRGAYGSRALPHTVTATAAIVSNRPRHWRGRLVELRAVLVTPDGELDTAQLWTAGKVCWRGFVSTEPRRRDGGFELECLALDRLLDRKLATAAQAEVVDFGSVFKIDPAFTFQLAIELYNAGGTLKHAYTLKVQPFSALGYGATSTTSEAHDMIQAGWAAALAATTDTITGTVKADTHLHDQLNIYKTSPNGYWYGGAAYDSLKSAKYGIVALWKADSQITKAIASFEVGNFQTLDWNTNTPATLLFETASGLTDKDLLQFFWMHNGNPQQPAGALVSPQVEAATGVMVRLAEVTAVPPIAGQLVVDGQTYPYTEASQSGALWCLNVTGLAATAIGKTGELRSVTSGTYPALMRQVLESSGAAITTYDTLGIGNGYALPYDIVDEDSFDSQAQGALALSDALLASQGGKSFAELFGGGLVLSQRAVCLREEGPFAISPCRIGLVSTEPSGMAYSDTIANDDLLSVNGEGVQVIEVRDQPTMVKTVFAAKDTIGELTVTVIDGPELAVAGGASIDANLLAAATNQAVAIANVTAWSVSLLRIARVIQAIDVMLPPWRNITLGGLLQVSLRHPDLWDPLTGQAALVGVARVVGLRRSLKDSSTIVTLLLGDKAGTNLCPSITPLSWTLAGATVTDINVDSASAQLILDAQRADGVAAITLLHTRPGCGAEDGGGSLLVQAVASAYGPASTTLTVALDALTQPLDSTSTLTWQQVPSTDYTDGFAHVDDAHVWS